MVSCQGNSGSTPRSAARRYRGGRPRAARRGSFCSHVNGRGNKRVKSTEPVARENLFGQLGNWMKLLRPYHYIKNVIVLFPAFFSGKLVDAYVDATVVLALISFCFVSSAIYVLNDICDIENDRKDPIKCSRPLARGVISTKSAVIVAMVLLGCGFATAAIAALSFGTWTSMLLLAAYVVLNVAYSLVLKSYPISDVVIVSSGFVIRVLYGGAVLGVRVSGWLFLTVASASMFLAFGKRRNEMLRAGVCARPVLAGYTTQYLTQILYVFMALSVVFYSLWAIQLPHVNLLNQCSILLVAIIFSEYARILELGPDGDPVGILRTSKVLMTLVTLFCALLFVDFYVL